MVQRGFFSVCGCDNVGTVKGLVGGQDSDVIAYWLARSISVATVGQLLFASWAWAYATLHPLGVGK